jgi:hypothetical protein
LLACLLLLQLSSLAQVTSNARFLDFYYLEDIISAENIQQLIDNVTVERSPNEWSGFGYRGCLTQSLERE